MLREPLGLRRESNYRSPTSWTVVSPVLEGIIAQWKLGQVLSSFIAQADVLLWQQLTRRGRGAPGIDIGSWPFL
jgi:hypothetical protein